MNWIDDLVQAFWAGIAVALAAVVGAVLYMTGSVLFATLAPAAEYGIASVYGGKDGYCGSRTANGERVDCGALTAAHKTLPLGSHARVTARNGRMITVRINDRGPFVRGRIIDLTPAGARALGFSGLAPVTVEPVR